jgi:transcriptional regulator with XRE-family HTH domain
MRALGRLRRVLGIKPSELADACGLSRRELHRIEEGKVHPHPATAEALDDALDGIIRGRLIESKPKERNSP